MRGRGRARVRLRLPHRTIPDVCQCVRGRVRQRLDRCGGRLRRAARLRMHRPRGHQLQSRRHGRRRLVCDCARVHGKRGTGHCHPSNRHLGQRSQLHHLRRQRGPCGRTGRDRLRPPLPLLLPWRQRWVSHPRDVRQLWGWVERSVPRHQHPCPRPLFGNVHPRGRRLPGCVVWRRM